MREIPDKPLAAMIGLLPLPGSPQYGGDDVRIVERALEDLEFYRAAGADVIVLENSHDVPYIKPPLPEAAADLAEHIAHECRNRFAGPIGIQMLEAANEMAFLIARRAGLDFLRVEGYVFAHVGTAGIIEGSAGKLQRLRAGENAGGIRFFGDIKKKHCAHALTGDLDIVDELRQAEFCLVDGVIVTGSRTGSAPDPAEVRRVHEAASVPVWIGSGMTPSNIGNYIQISDGYIVGSTFRENGEFLGELQPDRLEEFMRAFREARGW